MRTRLPAALLLVLSWLLPAIGHGEAVHQVAAVHQAVVQAPAGERTLGQEPLSQAGPGPLPQVRQGPLPQPAAQVRHAAHDQAGPGGQALPAAVAARLPRSWAAVVRRPAPRVPAARPHGAAAARAPPSTVL